MEDVLKMLKEQLYCVICFDMYTNPKRLQCCGHVYCQQCLVPMVDRDQKGRLGIACPSCRQVTPVPDRGTAGLQTAFQTNKILEIYDKVKARCVPSFQLCVEHRDEEVRYYCDSCAELVCFKCSKEKHRNHDCKEFSDAFDGYKKEIGQLTDSVEKRVTKMEKALAELNARCEEISGCQATTKDNIHGIFRELQASLVAREAALISQLDDMARWKLEGIAAQKGSIASTLDELNSTLDFVKEGQASLPASMGELLMIKRYTVGLMTMLTPPIQPEQLKPNAEADMQFLASSRMTSLCRNHGSLFSPGLPDPSKCRASGKGVDVAVVEERCEAVLQTINFHGKPGREPVPSLECEAVSEITGARMSCSVVRGEQQGQYKISYQPTIKGRHQLHIKVSGQHIQGSPFAVAVKLPVEKLGVPIHTIDGVEGPWGVAITQKGEVVLSEPGKDCISVFSASGEKLRSFVSQDQDQTPLHRPRGVAVDGDGNILVADSWNHCIKKFTTNGQLLATVGAKGTKSSLFSTPTAIALNASNGNICVVDKENNRIKILRPDLTFFKTFGKKGNGEGQFQQPLGVTCDSTGKIYVADSGNHRIQVFTDEGKFLRIFGQSRGDLDKPVSVAVDTSDLVYVSDSGNNRITLYTSEGQLVTSFGKRGVGPGAFKCPHGIAVDQSGVLYVCDNENNRLQIF
jgi:tripartite motif-containing protein 2/3/tripartite motif-containing protein 71